MSTQGTKVSCQEGVPPASGQVTEAESVRRRPAADVEVLLDSVPAYIWYKDCENRILRANRLAAESIGMTAEGLEGRSVYDLYPEKAPDYHRDDLEVIRSGRPKLGIIETMKTASGEARWLRTDKTPYRNDEGELVGVIVFAVDISERVRAEEALQRAHEELERRVSERTQQLADTVAMLHSEMGERQRAEERLHQQQAEIAHVLR